MELFLYGATTVVVAALTAIGTEPIRMLLYRNKHIHQKRFLNQAEALPKYIIALGWAEATCTNVSGGWQHREPEKPFKYASRAIDRLIKAINLGLDLAFLFPKDLEDNILAFGRRMTATVNSYMLKTNSKPVPTEVTPDIFKDFDDMASELRAKRTEMEQHYRKIVDLKE
jgi:hypothetical protein